MKINLFNKLLKENKEDPHMLIVLHQSNKIYLTSKQFDKVVELRNKLEKKGEGRITKAREKLFKGVKKNGK